ncbi:hypothetical protein [Reinekea sp.]|jgi:hypothetical protein|uniref:hypothetical protein n=1 Tax=Reinekea sp. TaxID=1970455 RepID=UPI003989FE9E
MKYVIPTILFTSIALVGCNPGDSSKGTMTLNIKADKAPTAKQATRAINRAATAALAIDVIDVLGSVKGTVTLTDAWVVIEEIELEHEDDYAPNETEVASAEDIEFEGPFVLDLKTNTVYPELPMISIKSGTYTDIEFDLEPLLNEDLAGLVDLDEATKAQLTGKTIYFKGDYQALGSADTVPFSLETSEEIDFELNAQSLDANGFVIDSIGINDVIVAFKMATWFDFSNLETNEYDHLDLSVFDSTTGIALTDNNAQILDVIAENIEFSADYGVDEDDDGELDDEDED